MANDRFRSPRISKPDSVVKQLNIMKIPVVCFASDGATIFRKHMMEQCGYTNDAPPTGPSQNEISELRSELSKEVEDHGWLANPLWLDDESIANFVSRTSDMVPSPSSTTLTPACDPYTYDDTTKVNFFVGMKVVQEIFAFSSPVYGGLPRTCMQDQPHNLRKMKNALQQDRVLRMGKYTKTLELFSSKM
jgi:hypothetical protein